MTRNASLAGLKRYRKGVAKKPGPEALSMMPADRWYQWKTAGQAQSGLWAPLLLKSTGGKTTDIAR